MDDATPPQLKRGRGRPPTLPNGLKAQKLDDGRWQDELGKIWEHSEATATARKRAVDKCRTTVFNRQRVMEWTRPIGRTRVQLESR